MSPELRARVAAALGWTVEGTEQFSLLALRELVRPVDAALAAEMTEARESYRADLGLVPRRRRR